FIYNKLNKVIGVSVGASQSAIDLFNIKNIKNVVTIYNPINVEAINQLALETNENPGGGAPYIVSVGRLIPEKGFDILIDAFNELIKKEKTLHNLVILGEGPERKNLENKISKLSLENRVFLVGYKDNPYTWIKSADLFVLSSRLEGFSLVLVEALALHTPIVSFDCPSGPAEILEDGKYGILVREIGYKGLENGMLQALDNIEKGSMLDKRLAMQKINNFSIQNALYELERIL
ncbi:glycosyltransferase, partial [Bacillus sp. JJ783]|uniref:glycosyltransferase n=1 Tax=Bacillus sp. JJ783 TaxID=3122974 RepID=UPI003001E9A3